MTDDSSRASAAEPRVSLRDPSFVRLLVDASPDTRSDRVRELRLMLQTGLYDFDARRVAEGMIRSNLRGR